MSKIDNENAKILRNALDVVLTMGDKTFSNNDIVKCNVVLRGTMRNISDGTFSQEGSEIDFEVLVDGSSDTWINFVKEYGVGTPITYSSGYVGDMSTPRTFYLNTVDYDAKTRLLSVYGVDATIYLLDKEYGGAFIESTYADVRADFYDAIKRILDDAGIVYTEAGAVPSGTGSTATNIFFEKKSARDIIAEVSGLYKNGGQLAITYRDGGIPQLIAGDSVSFWEMSESDVADFTLDIQKFVSEYTVTLPSYSVGTIEELVTQSDCVVGEEYFIESSDPIYDISTTTNCTAEKLGMYTIKITCTASGTCTVNGRKIIATTSMADAPRHIYNSAHNGITVDLGTIQKLNSEYGSLTARAVEDMIKEPTEMYKFTYRGDPRVQPSDIIRINRYTAGRLRPREDLYPSDSLIPDGDAYIDLRVQSITLDHEDGGLKSDVEARVLTLYETPSVFYPLETLYPVANLFPA